MRSSATNISMVWTQSRMVRFVALVSLILSQPIKAFTGIVKLDNICESGTVLFGRKKLVSKQADLQEKLRQARIQNGKVEEGTPELSESEVKQENDKRRFEELLQRGVVQTTDDNGDYLSRSQEEEESQAVYNQVDRLFEGDPFPVESLQRLVDVAKDQVVGDSSSNMLRDYLIVVTDPRPESDVLRESIINLQALPLDLRNNLAIINADRPSVNRKWLKKKELSGKVRLFSDESKESMKEMSALGANRWSLTFFVVANGKVQRLARDVDQYSIASTVGNAVKSFKSSTI